jgi:hypothetical protein
VKNLRRDGRAVFSVQEDQPPFAAAILHGMAEVATGDGAEISDEIRRITRRYIPVPDVESYIAQWSALRTIVTLRVQSSVSWGSGY